MKNTITREQIDALMAASDVDVCTKFDKVTVVTVRLPNGFVLVEASGAVDKANYNEEIGRKTCLDRIATKLWSFEGYRLACDLASPQLSSEIGDTDAARRAVVKAELDRDAFHLCRQIERCGASEELTTASVMASELSRKIGAL